MQSHEGCITHILQTLYELDLRRQYQESKAMCHCYESLINYYLFLAQKNYGSRNRI